MPSRRHRKRWRKRLHETALQTNNGGIRLHEDMSALGEYCRVDRDNGIIRGVKIVGYESRNIGRTIGLPSSFGEARNRRYVYAEESLNPSLYEGVKVRIDHPQFEVTASGERRPKNGGERSVLETFGELHNVRRAKDGLYGDIHANRDDRDYSQLMTMAEQFPNQLALSHNAAGDAEVGPDGRAVIHVAHVESVDLVGSNPGTTKNLFEQFPAQRMEQQTERAVGQMQRQMQPQQPTQAGPPQPPQKKQRKRVVVKKKKPDENAEAYPTETRSRSSMMNDRALLEQMSELEARVIAIEDRFLVQDDERLRTRLMEQHGVDTSRFRQSHHETLKLCETEAEITNFIETLPPSFKANSCRVPIESAIEQVPDELEVPPVGDLIAQSQAL